jgi:hypothetical protein
MRKAGHYNFISPTRNLRPACAPTVRDRSRKPEARRLVSVAGLVAKSPGPRATARNHGPENFLFVSHREMLILCRAAQMLNSL